MKILLINNNTEHLSSLQKSLSGHAVEIQNYRPGLDFHANDKDLVILSGGGGEGLEIHDVYEKGKLWYEDQMRFIRDCQLPMLGICMGFEVIATAFGGQVKEGPTLTQGFFKVSSTAKGQEILNKDQLTQFESHYWQLQNAPRDFEILADSHTGIEVIQHKKRPILATQFHPEKGGSLSLDRLLLAFN